MKKYNFTDCQPIGEYSKEDINYLEQTYRIKLKKSGFNDIEKWTNIFKRDDTQIKFIKGHIRWSFFKTKEQFIMTQDDAGNYFRLLGLFAYHAPESLLPEKYRAILQSYAQIGSMPQAIKENNSTLVRSTVHGYLERNHKKIMNFLREEFKDE